MIILLLRNLMLKKLYEVESGCAPNIPVQIIGNENIGFLYQKLQLLVQKIASTGGDLSISKSNTEL
jgi:hypothetical protein